MPFKPTLYRLLAAAAPDRWWPVRHASILMYHGVLPPDAPPSAWTQLPAADFERQMAWLRRRFRPVPLDELARCLTEGRPFPPRAVAVTFDDGLRNNAAVAAPILRRFGIPATIFAVSSFVLEGRLLWVDRLYLAAAGLTRDPARARDMHAALEAAAGLPLPVDPAAWVEYFKSLPVAVKNAAMVCLDALCRDLCEGPAAEPFRPMTPDDLRALDADPLFSVGGHTLTHEILSRCDAPELRRQVAEDKKRLESLLGHPVTTFAYPNGRPCDVTPEAVAAAREAGYRCACTTVWDNVPPGADLFALARLGMGPDDLADSTLLLRLSLTGLHPRLKRLLGD